MTFKNNAKKIKLNVTPYRDLWHCKTQYKEAMLYFVSFVFSLDENGLDYNNGLFLKTQNHALSLIVSCLRLLNKYHCQISFHINKQIHLWPNEKIV